ncbi:MAG: hypothetical protein GX803_09410 [Lentisphaerae bacterium]|nr:hypothetical protein [Lentisphaerota bacterium]
MTIDNLSVADTLFTMPRKLRIHFPGAIYHITMRGVNRGDLFLQDTDRLRFLEQLAESVEKFRIRLYLYSLMPNHIHLLLETPRGNLSAFMHRLQTAYSVYFNRKHDRSGHVMQGRYGAKLVQGDSYLLKLSRYIHLNPIEVKTLENSPVKERIKLLREYPWSSYQGYAGLAPLDEMLEPEPILAMMPGKPERRMQAYRTFVETGAGKSDAEFQELLEQSRLGVGDSKFLHKIQKKHIECLESSDSNRAEALRQKADSLPPELVIRLVAKAFGIEEDAIKHRNYRQPARPAAIYCLRKYTSLNQREIAQLLNIGSFSAVSQALRRLQTTLLTNHQLAEILNALEKQLDRKTS